MTAGDPRPARALAVAMALLAVSNLMKPFTQAFDPSGNAGFVLFGTRLTGAANAVAGPLFGLLLAAYAWGAWHRRRWVVPLALAYAAYVAANLVLFFVAAPPSQQPSLVFSLVYAAVAVGVSAGGAAYLYRDRERLS